MTYLKIIIITILTVLAFSCQKEEDLITNEKDTTLMLQSNGGTSSSGLITPPSIIYSKTELIVQYDISLTEDDKAGIRNYFQVPAFEACMHCDGTIEKWDFGIGADIEHKYATAREKEAEAEGLFMVDREFDFAPEDAEDDSLEGTGIVEYSSKIVTANSGVTIAILDSGIDAYYPSFYDSFLYKNEGDEVEVQSGWDYVEEDDNCYDDNVLAHGTAVASIINDYLILNAIPYQILPMKVADQMGVVSLFDAYCGISYAAERADLIQMSFGWYDSGEEDGAFTNDIFQSLIQKYEDVLFVTSAGNSGYDNDDFGHYPSNYDGNNVIAIAAANEAVDDMAWFSNYGALSVDFISVGTNIPFAVPGEGEILISGTSFSAPLVTAIAAKKLYESGMELTPSGIVSSLFYSGVPAVDFTKPTKYNKILLP